MEYARAAQQGYVGATKTKINTLNHPQAKNAPLPLIVQFTHDLGIFAGTRGESAMASREKLHLGNIHGEETQGTRPTTPARDQSREGTGFDRVGCLRTTIWAGWLPIRGWLYCWKM